MLLSDVQQETLFSTASNHPQNRQSLTHFNDVTELRDTAEESLRLLCQAIYDERFPALFGLDVYGSIVGMFELNNLGRAYTASPFHIICCVLEADLLQANGWHAPVLAQRLRPCVSFRQTHAAAKDVQVHAYMIMT